MKLDIDLNKLSLDELDIVLKMAKKQAKMPEEDTVDFPPEVKLSELPESPVQTRVRRRRKYAWSEILPKMKEYVMSKKGKPVTAIKMMRRNKVNAAGLYYAMIGSYLKGCKEIVEVKKNVYALKNGKWTDAIKPRKSYYTPVKEDKRVARMKYMSARMNQLMKQDVTMSREKAAMIASQEWAAHKPLGNVSPVKKKFNWTLISNVQPEKVREIVLHQLKTTGCVEAADFEFLKFEDNQDFYLFASKILAKEKEILEDLGLEGKIVWDSISLVFYRKGELR